jgi:hypothetical protein
MCLILLYPARYFGVSSYPAGVCRAGTPDRRGWRCKSPSVFLFVWGSPLVFRLCRIPMFAVSALASPTAGPNSRLSSTWPPFAYYGHSQATRTLRSRSDFRASSEFLILTQVLQETVVRSFTDGDYVLVNVSNYTEVGSFAARRFTSAHGDVCSPRPSITLLGTSSRSPSPSTVTSFLSKGACRRSVRLIGASVHRPS